MLNGNAAKRPALDAESGEPVAIFVSDIHLKESHSRTTHAFLAFLRIHAIRSKQLFLLGDLFEYWAGDDDIDTPFNRQIVNALRSVTDSGVELCSIAGNRDFLIGPRFARETGAELLPDPYVAVIGKQKLVLAHGDAQCTDDVAYMAFRGQVREPGWQQSFLARPLFERKEMIDSMRVESRAAQRDKLMKIMDVNAEAIETLFDETDTSVMIHGHTHRPARHDYCNHQNKKRVRYVLPDWECDVKPERGGWISAYANGTIKRFDLNGNEID
jgi:UDP-2,3-diacylglucosamine hydrolase